MLLVDEVELAFFSPFMGLIPMYLLITKYRYKFLDRLLLYACLQAYQCLAMVIVVIVATIFIGLSLLVDAVAS